MKSRLKTRKRKRRYTRMSDAHAHDGSRKRTRSSQLLLSAWKRKSAWKRNIYATLLRVEQRGSDDMRKREWWNARKPARRHLCLRKRRARLCRYYLQNEKRCLYYTKNVASAKRIVSRDGARRERETTPYYILLSARKTSAAARALRCAGLPVT